jgi:hypothetical protein
MSTVTEDIPLGATLTEEQARQIFSQGEEAVVFALLQLAKQLAEQKAAAAADSHQTPSTPSGMKPPYTKPPAKPGKRKPGRKKGHPGARRETPEHVDWQVEHEADRCPDCGGPLNRCSETRTRYTEDIPDIEPEVTEHTIHRDWCPKCRKKGVCSIFTGDYAAFRVRVACNVQVVCCRWRDRSSRCMSRAIREEIFGFVRTR